MLRNRRHLDLKLNEAGETIQAVVARQTGDQGVEVREARWKDTRKEAKPDASFGESGIWGGAGRSPCH